MKKPSVTEGFSVTASILSSGAKLICHFLKRIIANEESELGGKQR
jgi:hypothetical protein